MSILNDKQIKKHVIENNMISPFEDKLVSKGIIVKSMYMFGNPGDDESTIKNTIDYSMSLPNQLVQCKYLYMQSFYQFLPLNLKGFRFRLHDYQIPRLVVRFQKKLLPQKPG